MNVLIACEESQRVCIEFRKRGHNAFSCDLQNCSGGHPEWHINKNVFDVLNGYTIFKTQDRTIYTIDGHWDLIIAHPPCTYLTTAATQCHSLKCYSDSEIIVRTYDRLDAMRFFMDIMNSNCPRIAIENPTGVMNTCYRKPDQIIQPYYFAENTDSEDYVTKRTCLWLKNLPLLTYEENRPNPMDNAETWGSGKKKNWTESNHGSVLRSKTFIGVARAMAEQWGDLQ